MKLVTSYIIDHLFWYHRVQKYLSLYCIINLIILNDICMALSDVEVYNYKSFLFFTKKCSNINQTMLEMCGNVLHMHHVLHVIFFVLKKYTLNIVLVTHLLVYLLKNVQTYGRGILESPCPSVCLSICRLCSINNFCSSQPTLWGCGEPPGWELR